LSLLSRAPRVSLFLDGGTLFYSLWVPEDGRHPMPEYRFATPNDNHGKARGVMSELTGGYDLRGWETAVPASSCSIHRPTLPLTGVISFY